MFANSDRSTKRRFAGYLGGLLGASSLLLAVYPGIAAAAPALAKLTLTAECTLPGGNAIFRVGNTNALAITYTWDIDKTSFSGKAVATVGNSYLEVPPSSNNTRLFVDGKQQATKKQNADTCVFHLQPVKVWLDGSGSALTSPTVPKGWTLTLTSDLETVTCTWTKAGALKCVSKVDAEDKGTFANEGATLEVPFGGSYTVAETATPDYKQVGTGKFGPLEQPADLAAYFETPETKSVVVTNQSGGAIAPTTTVAAPTTTTTVEESTTTTTVAEPTTTTTVEEPTTTTTVEEPTTTTTVEESTTTTTVEESTTTTTVEESTTTTTVEESTTTTTVEEPTTTSEALVVTNEEPTTTLAATTTQAPPTTLAPAPTSESPTTTLAETTTTDETGTTEAPRTTQAPTTTIAPSTHELDPAGVEGAVVRAETVAGSTADPGAGVEPASDTLPITGAATVAATVVGFALVGIGLFVLLLGRRRLV